MSRVPDARYRLSPGIDAVPLADGNLLFRSDVLAIRIEGNFARVLAERVLPLLGSWRSLTEIAAALPDLPAEELGRNLEALARSQVLHRAEEMPAPPQPGERELAPFLSLLEGVGMTAGEALDRLGGLRVALFGVAGHGAQAAALLARWGVGSLLLADPFPCAPADSALALPLGPDAVGRPRQEALRDALQAHGGRTCLDTAGDGALTRERVGELAAGSHLLVGSFDRGFAAAHHWINRASLALGIPAIYSEPRGEMARVGPLVLPGQTACYMCYRMRSIACEEDFQAAMSYEEHLDRQRSPALDERPALPGVASYVASLVVLDAVKHLLALASPALAGRVLEFDGLTFHSEIHAVLAKPDCPVCAKKKARRAPPDLAELARDDGPRGDPAAASSELVSRRTGVVREVQLVPKDAGEPARPYVIRARLADHRYLGKQAAEHQACSGKGMTLEAARASALGEAVERYSGACWDEEEIVYARRSELDGPLLDPRQMVLFAPAQYGALPYAPYTGDNVLGWVRARSLVTGLPVQVPALAVYMSYEPRRPEELLCPITSNGLAAGPTRIEAVLAAAVEVLERDAVMIAWLNRLPCRHVGLAGPCDPEIALICEAYRRRGVEIELYRMPSDHPVAVFAALALQADGGEGPAAVMGLGADFDPRLGARKAVLEVAQVRPGLRQSLRRPEVRRRLDELVEDPRRVATLEDHDLLYAHPKALPALDFLRAAPPEPMDWEMEEGSPDSPAGQLQALADHFRATGGDLLYYDLTPPDMLPLGLYTARALVPGFQPIDFGWSERRLGGERLYELPHRLGLAAGRTTLEQLNPDPHPIA